MATLMVLIGMLSLSDSSYFLYLKDGRVLEVQEMPHFEGRFCYFSLQNGDKSMLASELIDFAKTEQYNQELKSQQELTPEGNSETEIKEDSPKKEEPKQIKLKGNWQLDKYKDKESVNTGDTFNQGTMEQTDVLGKPRIKEWSNAADDLFLAKETVSRTRLGYQIDCVLKVNKPSGVKNARLRLTVNLDSGETISFEKPASPPEIAFEAEGLVSFFVETEYLLEGTSYSVFGELP